VILVDELFKTADGHGEPSKLLDFLELLVLLLVVGLDLLLLLVKLDELFLH